MQLTELLTSYIQSVEYNDFPDETVQKAKLCVLDWLGVTLAGSNEPCTNIVNDMVKEFGSIQKATVLGKHYQTSVPWAALINGTASHALDYDDVILSEPGHPSGPVIAAALAVSEADNLTGKEFLTSVIIGIHVEQAIGSPIIRQLVAGGWHSTSIIGHFGAVAACSRLLRLSINQTQNALGIAATQAAGIRTVFGTMGKPLHVGKAAMNGLIAASLAQRGFTGGENAMDNKTGFLEVFASVDSKNEISALLLDERYSTLNDVGFKRYPSCFLNATIIECVLALLKRNNLSRIGQDIVTRIECRVYPDVLERVNNPAPKTGLEGKFSVQFCVAAALMDGEITMDTFTDSKVQNADIIKLMSKIELIAVEIPYYTNERCSECIITFADGVRDSVEINLVKLLRGLEKAKQDVFLKFDQLMDYVGLQKESDILITKVDGLEEIESVRTILDDLKPSDSSGCN